MTRHGLPRSALASAVASARWALRTYARSATLIAVAGVVGLAVALPVVGAPPLAVEPLRDADPGIAWTSLVTSAAALQRRGLSILSGLLLGMALAVLAVTLLTVWTLAAALASARRSEMALRRAVGGSRRALLAGGAVEGGAVAAVTLLVGVPLGIAGLRLAVAAWPWTAGAGAAGPLVAAAAGLGAAILAGALFPVLAPARNPAARPAHAPSLVVPAVQLGLSLVILVTAAQLARHADTLISGPPTARSGGGEIVEVVVEESRPARRAARYAAMLRELSAAFDVVSLSGAGALAGLGPVDVIVTDCGRCTQGGIATPQRPVAATVSVVSADTFRAMGFRLLRGRGIGPGDGWGAPRVAVVNQALAAGHFESGDAVGRQLLLGRGAEAGWYTVVGVVEHATVRALGGGIQPPYAVYLSALQFPPRAAELLVRTAGAPSEAAVLDRALAATLGPEGTVVRRMVESQWRARGTAPLRWFERMLWIEGIAALALALFGACAAMHLWVTGVRRELALRRAVGARRRSILGFVLLRAIAVAGWGIGLGLWLGELASGALGEVVRGLPGRDAGVVLPVALPLVAAALVGALVPAWRVARARPATFLGA